MTMMGIRFDLRVPPFSKATHAEQYAACLDQCAWADEAGLDVAVLSEHHGVDDGYMSSPVTLAAAIAGRTKRIPINIAAALIPLHDPVRLAEQLATASLVSGGRVSFDGADLTNRHYRDIVKAGLIQVPEGRRIFPNLSVRENLELGAFARARERRAANLERVFATFPRLAERTEQKAGTMSGGEQQMLAIGRGLMADHGSAFGLATKGEARGNLGSAREISTDEDEPSILRGRLKLQRHILAAPESESGNGHRTSNRVLRAIGV